MTKVVPIEQMRRVESAADASGLTYDMMMENAGRAAAECAFGMLAGQERAQVVVLVGAGNNGGDGLVAARYLAQADDVLVHCYMLKPRTGDDHNFAAAQDAGVNFVDAEEDRDREILRAILGDADLVIDALFGIGVRLPIKENAAKLMASVTAITQKSRETQSEEITVAHTIPMDAVPTRKRRVLAIDCPSGLDCDTGEIDENVIPADETVTFIAAKPGLFAFPGARTVGRLSIAPVGVPASLPELQEGQWTVATHQSVRELLPERQPDSHKGTYGKAMIIAGSLNYIGAPGLAAEGAYRAGAGLVTVGAPGPVVTTLAARLAEPTWLMLPHDLGVISEKATELVLEQVAEYQALLLGPGWGQEETTGNFLRQLLEDSGGKPKPQKRRAIGFMPQEPDVEGKDQKEDAFTLPPLVIDADGLNLLAETDKWWSLLPGDTIITPHPGEMGRLARMSTKDIQSNRWQVAGEKAAEWEVVLVLKGALTLVAAPDGRITVLPFKTDALASGGTGDILAGLITGMLAQGLEPFEAATVGGYVHGLAGELAQEYHGSARAVIAGDVLKMISHAWRNIEHG